MLPTEIAAFPAALNLERRAVLVIGGGEEAVQKVPKLLAAGAQVAIVASAVAEPLAAAARRRELTWYAREFVPDDLAGCSLVMLTEIDPTLGAELRALTRRARCWLCAIDQPALSDLYLVSTVTSGPVQVAISTGGRAPLLARRLRQALDRALDQRFSEFARKFARLRADVRSLPKEERRQVLERALDGFAMEVSVRYPEPHGQGAGHPPSTARDE